MSEVEKYAERMAEQGLTYAHYDWTEEGQKLTAEQKAAELNRIMDWLAVPVNDLVARLSGQLMLLDDTIGCMRNRFNCLTMTASPLTRAEEVQVRNKEQMAALLRETIDFITALSTPSTLAEIATLNEGDRK